MKSILISIQPQWVEKILNGEKTVEIRKTVPKCELPCRVYIYCTKGRCEQYSPPLSDTDYKHAFGYVLNGKVVAEFILRDAECFTTDYRRNAEQTEKISKNGCIDISDMIEYEQGSPCLYAWHIDNLKIYFRPIDLNKFCKPCKHIKNGECFLYSECCKHLGIEIKIKNGAAYGAREHVCCRRIERPPQSWCYVEGLYEN